MTADAVASWVLGGPGPRHLLPGCLQHIEECITIQQHAASCCLFKAFTNCFLLTFNSLDYMLLLLLLLLLLLSVES